MAKITQHFQYHVSGTLKILMDDGTELECHPGDVSLLPSGPHEFTVFLSIKEFETKPKIKCPQCQSDNVQKKISAFIAKISKKS